MGTKEVALRPRNELKSKESRRTLYYADQVIPMSVIKITVVGLQETGVNRFKKAPEPRRKTDLTSFPTI